MTKYVECVSGVILEKLLKDGVIDNQSYSYYKHYMNEFIDKADDFKLDDNWKLLIDSCKEIDAILFRSEWSSKIYQMYKFAILFELVGPKWMASELEKVIKGDDIRSTIDKIIDYRLNDKCPWSHRGISSGDKVVILINDDQWNVGHIYYAFDKLNADIVIKLDR